MSPLWSDVWHYISQLEVGLSLLQSIPPIVVFIAGGNWILRWQRGRRSSPSTTPNVSPPRHRPRRSAVRVSELSCTGSSEDLGRYIAGIGLVPIERSPHRSRMVAAWREVKYLVLLVRASPKPAFMISDWRCSRIPGQEPNPSGFVLAVKLNQNENRRHLQATLRSGFLPSSRPRLVAIASVTDLLDPMAWVRCYAVDADRTSICSQDTAMMGVQSSDYREYGVPPCRRTRRGEVPEGTTWLITDNPDYAGPACDWGRNPEIFETEDHTADPTPPPDAIFADHYGRLAQSVRHANLGRIILLLTIGPGVALVYWLGFWPARIFTPGIQNPIDSALVPILVAWLALWIQLFALSLLYHAYQYCRAGIWRWRDNQGRHSKRAWRGGTLDCFFLGSVARQGKLLTPSDWERYWGNRQCDKLTPSSEIPRKAAV